VFYAVSGGVRCRKPIAQYGAGTRRSVSISPRITTDADARRLLLIRAREWLKLAYSEGDTELERILSAFNKEQPRPAAAQTRPAMQRMGMPRQSRRQQQDKSEREDNGSSRP
jgi:hypothetical protein